MEFDKSSQIYDAGLALKVFDISDKWTTFKHRDTFFRAAADHPTVKVRFCGVDVDATQIESLRGKDGDR